MINGINKIYVLHHTPMIERKTTLNQRLTEEYIECEWVESFKPDEIEKDYEIYLKNWESYKNIDIIHPYGIYKNFSKKISIGSLSLILKHLWCFDEQIKNNYENILILEDDAVIPTNFIEYLNNNMNDFLILNKNEQVEMLMIGTSHNYRAKNIEKNKYAHYNENQKTRCTHAYVINISATKKIKENFKPINLSIDFKLNEIIQVENIKVAWSEPGLEQSKIN